MKSTSVKLFIVRPNLKQVIAQIKKPISSSVTVWSFLSSTSLSETVFKSQNAQYYLANYHTHPSLILKIFVKKLPWLRASPSHEELTSFRVLIHVTFFTFTIFLPILFFSNTLFSQSLTHLCYTKWQGKDLLRKKIILISTAKKR